MKLEMLCGISCPFKIKKQCGVKFCCRPMLCAMVLPVR